MNFKQIITKPWAYENLAENELIDVDPLWLKYWPNFSPVNITVHVEVRYSVATDIKKELE